VIEMPLFGFAILLAILFANAEGEKRDPLASLLWKPVTSLGLLHCDDGTFFFKDPIDSLPFVLDENADVVSLRYTYHIRWIHDIIVKQTIGVAAQQNIPCNF